MVWFGRAIGKNNKRQEIWFPDLNWRTQKYALEENARGLKKIDITATKTRTRYICMDQMHI